MVCRRQREVGCGTLQMKEENAGYAYRYERRTHDDVVRYIPEMGENKRGTRFGSEASEDLVRSVKVWYI
jgi:hypothetical protein